MPVQPKTPKTPKVALRLCSWDYEDQHVELELSQTRIGKIVKFQFGILDNDPEEIAEKMVISYSFFKILVWFLLPIKSSHFLNSNSVEAFI